MPSLAEESLLNLREFLISVASRIDQSWVAFNVPLALLYHAFGIRGYRYVRTDYFEGEVVFSIEQGRPTLQCPLCGSRRVTAHGAKPRLFRNVPIGSKATHGTEQEFRAIFEREDGASWRLSSSDLGLARRASGLDARCFCVEQPGDPVMWREGRRSAAAGKKRVPRSQVSPNGPPPKWSFRLRCWRNRMTSVHSRARR